MLFFALIALVVMMLAAVALIRSVDTDTAVAGNLAFKQSATTSADSGIETAFALLANPALNKDVNSVENAASGYFATSEERNLTGNLTNPVPFTWDDSNSALATGTGFDSGKDASGNTIRYVIERMCSNAGVPGETICMSGYGPPSSNGRNPFDPYNPPPAGLQEPSPVYRVTARVVGPKNTISYIQAYLY